MRKIFSFRSSGSSNGSSNPAPPTNKVNWDKPSRNKLKTDAGNRSQRNSHSLKDFSTRPRKHGKSCESGLRRSLSFSSPITYCGPQWHMDSRDTSISPTTSNYPHQDYDYAIWGRSLTPERISKTKRVDQVETLDGVEKLDLSGASTGYTDSSWHSTYGSTVPLKCRAPRITQIPNKVLDRYIDGEQPERITRPKTEPCQMNSVLSGQDDFPIENRVLPRSSYPPIVQGKGPAFQKECHEHLNSHKFVGDVYLQNSGDWARDEVQPSSSQRLARSVIERLAESFPEKCGFESQDFNTETSTIVEDIYEEYPEIHPATYSNEFLHHRSQSSDARNGAADRYPIKVSSTLKEETMFAGDDPECLHYELSHLQEQVEVDRELQRKGQEVQKRVLRLLKQLEEGKVTNINIIYEMRNLVFEVLGQMQSRMAERASAGKAVKQAKIDFNSRIKRIEEEKSEFQASLRKELDRRSREWSFKLEQFQLEEQRLRERVRELAEQNISLQREVSSTNGKDMESITRILDLESQLNNATSRMEEMGSDNCKLQAVVSELQDQLQHAQSDRDSVVGSNKEKETETKDLHKAVVRLQRIYNEQDKTISGLQQGLFEKISTQSSEKCDGLVKLQLEQVRLTSVEQNLRREIEHYNIEINSLRQENITLLDRLNGGRSSFRLEEELKARVNYFQSRCFSLLKEASQISEKLLTLVKVSHINEGIKKREVKSGVEEFVVLEYDMKFQSFGRDVENFKRGLQALYSILQEKADADADASEFHLKGLHGRVLKEDHVKRELKAEILLTKALREKLQSQELELEKLEADLATSVRCNDILRCEVQRAQDAFSSLTHRMKDLELQMMRKNENMNQLQMDLKENMGELTGVQCMLTKVSGERDLMWEEVKQYSEKNMLLNCEVASLRKKIEALDEDILLKEGQITILKDTLKEKPFDIIYGTNSLKGCLFNEPF